MKREEAIKIIEANCSCSDSKLREACAMFIPELRESEDERVWKAIDEIMKLAKAWKIAGKHGLTAGDIRRWVKKQKEQKPISTEDMPYVTDEHFFERETADSFKYKLAMYMTRCCTKKEGPYGYSYSISSESILQMAKEELIKRGELKEQKPIWKPSEQQMKELHGVAYYCGNSSLSPYSISNKTLASLYNDLQRISI